MIEKLNRYTVGGRHILGSDPTKDEPSHIHLPRRRRLARPDDHASCSASTAGASNELFRGQAQPGAQDT